MIQLKISFGTFSFSVSRDDFTKRERTTRHRLCLRAMPRCRRSLGEFSGELAAPAAGREGTPPHFSTLSLFAYCLRNLHGCYAWHLRLHISLLTHREPSWRRPRNELCTNDFTSCASFRIQARVRAPQQRPAPPVTIARWFQQRKSRAVVPSCRRSPEFSKSQLLETDFSVSGNAVTLIKPYAWHVLPGLCYHGTATPFQVCVILIVCSVQLP